MSQSERFPPSRSHPPAGGEIAPAPRAWVAVGAFGFFSGLPLALSGSTLQAWYTVAGVDLKTIGLLSLVGWPYLLKFLWAPWLDRWAPLGAGRRRGWLMLTQVLLAAVLGACALTGPAEHWRLLAGLALLLAFASATQDVAVDAYRAEILPPTARGLGTAGGIAAYRAALFVAGAGALLIADHWSFRLAYLAMAALMLLGVGVSWFAPEPARGVLPAGTGQSGVLAPLHALTRRPGAASLLLLVACYKLGDQFTGSLAQTFFIRGLGFSLTEIATVYKALGLTASLLGGVLGGLLMYRLSLWRALLLFGLLQATTNLGFLWLALAGGSLPGMMGVVTLENFCGGMGTCAEVALLMAMCESRHTATQFALLSALASLGRVLLGPLAGMVAGYGWGIYFTLACLLALPGLALLVFGRRAFQSL